jgi:hypothetical protein
VKLLLVEPGSEAAGLAWDRAVVRTSSVALFPEARSAVAAAGREGRILEVERVAAIAVLDALWAIVDGLELTEPLARRAGELAEAHACEATTPSTSRRPRRFSRGRRDDRRRHAPRRSRRLARHRGARAGGVLRAAAADTAPSRSATRTLVP